MRDEGPSLDPGDGGGGEGVQGREGDEDGGGGGGPNFCIFVLLFFLSIFCISVFLQGRKGGEGGGGGGLLLGGDGAAPPAGCQARTTRESCLLAPWRGGMYINCRLSCELSS